MARKSRGLSCPREERPAQKLGKLIQEQERFLLMTKPIATDCLSASLGEKVRSRGMKGRFVLDKESSWNS